MKKAVSIFLAVILLSCLFVSGQRAEADEPIGTIPYAISNDLNIMPFSGGGSLGLEMNSELVAFMYGSGANITFGKATATGYVSSFNISDADENGYVTYSIVYYVDCSADFEFDNGEDYDGIVYVSTPGLFDYYTGKHLPGRELVGNDSFNNEIELGGDEFPFVNIEWGSESYHVEYTESSECSFREITTEDVGGNRLHTYVSTDITFTYIITAPQNYGGLMFGIDQNNYGEAEEDYDEMTSKDLEELTKEQRDNITFYWLSPEAIKKIEAAEPSGF